MQSTILVVDDDPDYRFMICEMLMMLGFKTLHACNGEQAVEVAGREQPALILMDLFMPIMDGYRAINELQSSPLTSGIPVIILSSHADAFSPRIHLPGVVDMLCKGSISMRDIAHILASSGFTPKDLWKVA
jgi:CheY-like chemotaxis protein